MPAILKSKHEKICQRIDEICAEYNLMDQDLLEMKTELEELFSNYQNQVNNLKVIIFEYEARQKAIRGIMRKISRNGVLVPNIIIS
jgi:flagellar biosynthesis chaperone FliJ